MGSDKKSKSDKGFEIKSLPNHIKKHDKKHAGGREQMEDYFERAFDKMENFETKYVVLNNVQPRVTRTSNDTRYAVKNIENSNFADSMADSGKKNNSAATPITNLDKKNLIPSKEIKWWYNWGK